MVRRGLAATPAEAEMAIRSGAVLVGGRPATTSATLVLPAEAISIRRQSRRFVSRGGEKLEAALEAFGIEVRGRSGLDAGASTGGFTDCLLVRGIDRVAAVDVGYGQLDWRLREDPRVTVLDRTNVRDLRPEALPWMPDVVVADLSFISLRAVLPALASCASEGANLVLLVKPQFEAARGEAPGGVVADPEVWRAVLEAVVGAAAEAGLGARGVRPSPILGPKGNAEFLLWASKGSPVSLQASDIEASVRAAGSLRDAGRG
jgi:23S rRNA (cytidine1920-2'-O)/16S rRNA (cytidine1409-2'-O)-methyltransferase